MIKDRDIVIVGQQPWDVEIGSNCKNIALEFSKQNRVLYVNSPLDTRSMITGRADQKIQKRLAVINKKEAGLLQLNDRMWTWYPDISVMSITWIGSHRLFNFFNKLNNKRFSGSISRAVRELGFKEIILFNDNDIYKSFYLKEFLKPVKSVYYSRDYMLSVDYWKKHGELLEPELIAKSDVCVANSVYLADYCRRYNPESYFVGQGCDTALFKKAGHELPPRDLGNIPKPVAGYVGALDSSRLDIPLLLFLAESKPGLNIVLVGPEDDHFKKSGLHALTNVHFLGSRPMDQLPAYINSFDVCLNPQLVNQATIGNYPRKIDEYLLMGKPVVAIKTLAMELFRDHVYLAVNRGEYLSLVEKAISEDSADRSRSRIEFASLHSWENNVKAIYKAINL